MCMVKPIMNEHYCNYDNNKYESESDKELKNIIEDRDIVNILNISLFTFKDDFTISIAP